jgi:hypothetical protein
MPAKSEILELRELRAEVAAKGQDREARIGNIDSGRSRRPS